MALAPALDLTTSLRGDFQLNGGLVLARSDLVCTLAMPGGGGLSLEWPYTIGSLTT